jgi:hypothetical protein
MTAVLRSRLHLNYLVPVKEKDINDYFKKVEARNWQLKHYLNHRLKTESEIQTWVTVYDDWMRSLRIINENKFRNAPSSICAFCHELLKISNTYEGSLVLKTSMKWYEDFYEQNFNLQFTERTKQLEEDILEAEKNIFSNHKIAELLQDNRKSRVEKTEDQSQYYQDRSQSP